MISKEHRLWMLFGAITFTLIVGAAPAFSGVDRWTHQGPEGGIITDIAFEGSPSTVMYAAVNGAGIFKSADGGAQWKAINGDLSNRFVTRLLVIGGGTIYAVAEGVLFKTVDGGQHWTQPALTGNDSAWGVSSILLERRDGQTSLFLAAGPGVYVSRDGGTTWVLTAGSSSVRSEGLILVSNGHGRMFAGTRTSLWFSDNGGTTWSYVNALSGPIQAVAIDPVSRRVFVANGSGIHDSLDGVNWNHRPRPAQVPVLALLPDATTPGAVYAATSVGAFYSSSSSSTSWTTFSPASMDIKTLVYGSADPQHLYAGTSDGLYVRQADGTDQVWRRSNSGLAGAFVADLAMAGENTLYAAAGARIFRSPDRGETWRTFPAAFDASKIVVDPQVQSTVYAGTLTGVFKSTDAGETWRMSRPTYAGCLTCSFNHASVPAVAPSAPENLYALVADAFVKSVNGGTTWIAGGPVGSTYYGYYGTSLTVDPVVPSTVYIASDGIFKSSDGGTTWSDLPTDRSLTADIRSIVIDPSNTSVMYAGVANHYYRGEKGILKSVDAGGSWTLVGLSSESVLSMVIDPRKPTTVYAGTQRGEIFRSVDSGAQWSRFGEPLDASALALTIDPSGRHIRAATPFGVYAYDIGDPRLPIERLPDDPTRLPRLLDQIGVLSVGENGAGSAFVIGAAGSVPGVGGTYFRSDVSLVNWRETAQKLIVVWLAQATDGRNAPAFQVTLPGQSSATSADTITSRDFVSQLDIRGLGSLLFIAVDSSGNIDTSAAVDGFSRTWTQWPGQSGTESQSTPGTGLGQMRGQRRAAALGLRQDGSFRTNVGLVNLDAQSHRFTIRAQGEDRTEERTVEVMPFSMVQVPLPAGNYGSLALTVATEATLPTFAWTFYGSSVDNVTGDSWMSTPSTIGPTP